MRTFLTGLAAEFGAALRIATGVMLGLGLYGAVTTLAAPDLPAPGPVPVHAECEPPAVRQADL